MIGSRASAGAFFATSVAIGLLTGPGCGTDAHGVEDCRSIEHARCAAASHCTTANGVPVVGDVKDCQRFYRDQCLRGTANSAADAVAVDDCVSAIRAAGDCAGADTETEDALCSGGQTKDAACHQILNPESLDACRFLLPPSSTGGNSGTGTGGAASQSGGSVSVEGGTAGAGGGNSG